MENLITVKNLCRTYIVNSVSSNVLQNVNFELGEGEFVAVMGPSGSGKSTLLYTVSGMDRMTSGSVQFKGRKLEEMSEKDLEKFRLHTMGFIFQQMYMMKKLSIFDNIVLPGYQAGLVSRKEVNARAEELMRNLGIMEVAGHDINEVSGGQLQRACLCRALINSPEVLFADEPTGSLNSGAAEEVMSEIRKVNRNGTAVMMVTHSIKVAAECDRVIYLADGSIRGEMKFNDSGTGKDIQARERKLTVWLMEQGW